MKSLRSFIIKLKRGTSLLLLLGLLSPAMPVRAELGDDSFEGAITGFTLINAATDTVIGSIENNQVINLAEYPKINIRADIEGDVESVNFESNFQIDNDGAPLVRYEKVAPFASAGDSGGNYNATWQPTLNDWYVLTATPYAEDSLSSLAGVSKTVMFMVVNDTEAPVISGVEDGAEYTGTVTPLISDESPYTAMLNDEEYVSGTPISAHGNYRLAVSDYSGKLTTVEFSIRDIEAPSAPKHVSPIDGTYLKSSELLKVDWDDVVDPTLPVTYQYESSNVPADEDGYFLNPAYTSAWLTDSEISTLGTPEGIYYWHVRAKDGADNESLWSKEGMFVVDDTAPEVGLLADLLRNKKETVEVIATDANQSAGLDYLWEAPEGVILSSTNSHETEISATLDGEYEIKVTVSDKAGNKTVKTFKLIWDTTVAPVTDFYAVTGSNFVDLHWKNPVDTDLEEVRVYRSQEAATLGALVGTFKNQEVVYEDDTVLGGVTYYYTVITVDAAGNTSAKEIVVTPELLVASTTVVPPIEEAKVAETKSSKAVETKEEPKEVKSETTENKTEEQKVKEEKTKLPLFGIVILILLALVGIYLLYLQYPGFFKKLNILKKTTKK